ncbi:MAG: hypothetical protein M3179_01505 [Actinomycetota bacterium]|nr:hypothetical protein [Actinomycetota bacterium]
MPRERLRSQRDTVRGFAQLKRNQALLAARVAEMEECVGKPVAPPYEDPGDPNFPPGVRSRVCTQSQVRKPWFEVWSCSTPWPCSHRVHGAWASRSGGNRSSPFFAGRGCHIVATDLPLSAKEARGWRVSGQLRQGLSDLRRDRLCNPDRFNELVTWRPVDMRAIPDDLRGFDFCWSACALEHLGSLEAGMSFVERSLGTLRPGGVAVHTTEYNVGADNETVATGPTVLYRKHDLLALAARLGRAGHQVAAFQLAGRGAVDEYVDVPPYSPEAHICISLGSFVTTSLALVVRASG